MEGPKDPGLVHTGEDAMHVDLSEEHQILKETVRRFAQQEIEPRVAAMDRDEAFDEYLWDKGRDLGFVGMGIGTAYGGSFSDYVSLGVMAEEVSRVDAGVAVVFGAHSVLCGNNIERNGTPEQKDRYLPRLASGERRGCMGITEPEAGSDALSIRTRAKKDGSVYVLSGTKMFISNAPIADTALIYATTDPSRGHAGLSAFIVEKDFPGYNRGRSLSKLGLRSSPTGEIVLEDCVVPEENLLGGEEGKGLSIMFSGLDVERILWSCQALGIAGAAFDASLRYARERRQFSQALISFQMIQDKLASMLVEIEAARLMAYQGLVCLDRGDRRRTRMLAAQVKLYACEMVNRVTTEALQIHGGYGYMKEFPLERYLRDGRAYAIGAGTSEIQKLIIGGYLMA